MLRSRTTLSLDGHVTKCPGEISRRSVMRFTDDPDKAAAATRRNALTISITIYQDCKKCAQTIRCRIRKGGSHDQENGYCFVPARAWHHHAIIRSVLCELR